MYKVIHNDAIFFLTIVHIEHWFPNYGSRDHFPQVETSFVEMFKKMYIFHKVSENHRWPVYGNGPHALYSHACVDACTIYAAYPDGLNR